MQGVAPGIARRRERRGEVARVVGEPGGRQAGVAAEGVARGQRRGVAGERGAVSGQAMGEDEADALLRVSLGGGVGADRLGEEVGQHPARRQEKRGGEHERGGSPHR